MTPEELAGFRFERVPAKMKSSTIKAKPTKATSSTTSSKIVTKKKSAAAESDTSAPRVLVERKELQSLQAERRTLFGRVDEATAESKELRDTIREREEEINVARVAAAQQHEVWGRHDALRCEERDTARAQAEAAEKKVQTANEARAAAENERTRLREQLAVSESESRRAQAEGARAIAQLEAVVAERRKTDEEKREALRDLREELSRERARASAAEARLRVVEPEKEAALTQLAAANERMSGAVAEAKALESALQQAEEMRHLIVMERDETRVRAEAAEQRADKFNGQRAASQEAIGVYISRISALEQAVVAAAEATKVGQERLRTETQALQAHIESAEERCKESERRRDALARQLEAERTEHARLVTTVHRTEERLMEEQVRASVAEERWQPLMRQRDDAYRERARAARALSAAHAEKRELQWAVSDLGNSRRGGVPLLPAHGSSVPMDSLAAPPRTAWEPTTSSPLGASSAAAGLARPSQPLRTTSTFGKSPYGRTDAPESTTPAGGLSAASPRLSPPRLSPPSEHAARRAVAEYIARAPAEPSTLWSDLPLHDDRGKPPELPSAAEQYRAKLTERIAQQQHASQQLHASSQPADAKSDVAMWAHMEDLDPWAALAETNTELEKRLERERAASGSTSAQIARRMEAERADISLLEQRLEFERAAASASNPHSTPWTFV